LCIHAGAWFLLCLSARVLNSNLDLNSNSFELRGKRKEEEKEKNQTSPKERRKPSPVANPAQPLLSAQPTKRSGPAPFFFPPARPSPAPTAQLPFLLSLSPAQFPFSSAHPFSRTAQRKPGLPSRCHGHVLGSRGSLHAASCMHACACDAGHAA